MKSICQLYMPSFYRSYGKNTIKAVTDLLASLKKANFKGVYLISLWKDGGYDNGFDVIEYSVNPKFGTDEDFSKLVQVAHTLDLLIGVDVVPNHVSDQNILAKNCLNDVPGYEDCLYVTVKDEAERLTKAGVPSFFGKLAYSDFDDKYVRSTFCDYHQLNLNWQSQKVKEYFTEVFDSFKKAGVDFVRVDCGMMLLEDVSKADPRNPMACMNPVASIEAIREVSSGMTMFFEWFDPASADIFSNMPGCYALDCSYVMTGQQNLDWNHDKLIPLVGGHDQMTLADRGIDTNEVLPKMKDSEYGFIDIQTLIGWKTEPDILPGDDEYDADLNNPNQRYRARRPIDPIIQAFTKGL